MIKVGSDFSGVGSFDQALLRLDIKHETIFACDKDKYARQTYLLNYKEPNEFPVDVYKRTIPDESLDIYMSSPPCQSFSIAGKRLGKDDQRGILFFNSYEFIKKNRPRYFIFENVRGLLSDDNGKTFQEWLNYLGGKSINGLPVIFPDDKAVPYHIYYAVINSKELNVPQNRPRVFIIGIRDDQDNVFQFPKTESLTKTLQSVLEVEGNLDKYYLSDKMIKGFITHKERHKEKGTGFYWQPKKETDIANCLRANSALCPTDNTLWIADYRNDEGLRIRKDNIAPCMTKRRHSETDISTMAPLIGYTSSKIIQNNVRRLTPRECFRLMDFPETFKWECSDTQAYKQAGNSIVVKCLEKIIEKFNLK